MKADVYNGIDNIATVRDELKGERLGLITGPSGVDKKLRPTYDIINDKFKLRVLYSPEHGIRGDAQAGLHDVTHIDAETGIKVYPLYGDSTYPSEKTLENIDIMLFDIQDVGSRFYTYLYTMTRAMQSCAKHKIPFYVLDRINPIGLNRLEGNILDLKYASFVGEYAIPTRYGMTIGEFARYINTAEKIECELTVVPCEGLTREMYFDDTNLSFVCPSPNIPTVDTAINYVGTCLFEGSNLSEGRGTTHPFEFIGAPWLKSKNLCERMNRYGFEGIIIRRAFFTPMFSKYAGEQCEGIQLHITDRSRYQPFEVSLRLIDEIRNEFPEFQFTNYIDKLFGDDKLRNSYIGHQIIDEFLANNKNKIIEFKNRSREFYLY